MAQPARVLHCIRSLGGGGAERDLRNFLLHNASARFEHGIYAWNSGEFEEALRARGVPVFIRPVSKRAPWTAFTGLAQVIREWQPRLLQSWGAQFDVLVGFVGRTMNVPAAGSEQSNGQQYDTKYGWRPHITLRPWTMRHCVAGVFANSPAGARYIRDDLRVRTPVHVIPNGLELDVIDAMPPVNRQSLAVSSERPLLAAAARLIPLKRIDLMVNAVALLRDRGLHVNLVVCGTGPCRPDLERLIAERNVEDRVFLLGHRRDVPGIMKSSDLFCNASEVEGMPNAVLEAMACGLPVVASSIPAHTDLLAERGAGALFESGSASALADRLQEVLTSPGLRAELAQKAHLLSREFTMERRCALLEAFHHELLEGNCRASTRGRRYGEEMS